MLTYTIANEFGSVPPPSEVARILLSFFAQHGLWIVAPICFLENLAPLNSWFPGAFAILTAMASTSGDAIAGVRMFFVIWWSSLLGVAASYAIGRTVGNREKACSVDHSSNAFSKIDWATAFIVFVHPQTGSLHTFRLGTRSRSWRKAFLPVLIAHFSWSVFWAVTTYKYGLWIYGGNTLLFLIWGYLLFWIGFESLKFLRQSHLRAMAGR